MSERPMQSLRFYRRVRLTSFALLLMATSLLIAATISPLSADHGAMLPAVRRFDVTPPPTGGIQPLLVRMAGQQLIRPSHVRAAVKDSGAAQRLLKQLKLQGVIASAGEYVAYIKIEKQPVRSVRQGNTVLEFTVDRIEPGRVQLSLEGVTVDLAH